MVTRTLVETVVRGSGLWDSGAENYRFILSPDVYEVPAATAERWNEIGAALADCLAGVGRIAATAANPQLGYGQWWRNVLRALRTGVPSIYNDISVQKPGRIPLTCKVDLMEGVDGSFYIAEIDGHNKHGLGYAVLAAQMRDAVLTGAKKFPGVAKKLADELCRRDYGNAGLVFLYADQERFYLPEFRILKTELKRYGIEMKIIAESEIEEREMRALFSGNWPNWMDLPFLYRNRELAEKLAEAYRQEKIDFVLPPKPFLGSKAVLALLRNDEGDEKLEAMLRSQIDDAALRTIRGMIPETYLVHKKEKPEHWLRLCGGRRFVLKETIASGMKGTVFPEDPRFEAVFASACAGYYRYVLQEEIRPKPTIFRYFEEEGEIREDTWYTRITAHLTARAVADVVVTARRDKKVHGAPDCLQLGTVIV